MFIKVNGKNLVVGMKWNVMITDGSVNKAVRATKASWYWNAASVSFYGTIPKEEKVSKKDLPLYSLAIAFSAMYADTNVLAVVSIPGSDLYVVSGTSHGRPQDGFDRIATSLDEVAELIKGFAELCEGSSYSLMGDVVADDILHFSFEELAGLVTEYALLKKVKSELVNPVTIMIGVVCLGLVGNLGWSEYVKYRKAEMARKMAATQKTAQQLYDDSLARKRGEIGILASDTHQIADVFLKLPPAVGGWNLELTKCRVTPDKSLNCLLQYAKGLSLEANNKTFLAAATPHNFKSITYLPNLKTIEAKWVVTDLPVITLGQALDAAVPQKQELLEFGAQLQKLLPFGSPSIGTFTPVALPPGIDQSQLASPPLQSAIWKPSGPVRIVELMKTFPKYAVIEEINFAIGKSPRYKFTESFATVEVLGTVFAKPN